jgi:WD40 repeat protein
MICLHRFLLVISVLLVLGWEQESELYAQANVGSNTDLDWTSDGTRLAAAYTSGTVQIYDQFGELLKTFDFPDGVSTISWDPLSNSRLALGDFMGRVRIINTNTGEVIRDFGASQATLSVAWSPDGSRLANVGRVGMGLLEKYTVWVWDVNQGNLLNYFEHTTDATYVNWNPQNSNQLAVTSSAGKLAIWDIRTNTQIFNLQQTEQFLGATAWNPNGHQIAVIFKNIDLSAEVKIIDIFTGQIIHTFGDGRPSNLAWSASGQLAVYDRRSLTIYNTDTLEILTVYSTDILGGVAWSPSGLLAYGSAGSQATPIVITNVSSGNYVPIPNAGTDQTLTDANSDGTETVTLDGSASSDRDGTIVSYAWHEGQTLVATGVTPQVRLSVGTHRLILTVTDQEGSSTSDDVMITILAPS